MSATATADNGTTAEIREGKLMRERREGGGCQESQVIEMKPNFPRKGLAFLLNGSMPMPHSHEAVGNKIAREVGRGDGREGGGVIFPALPPHSGSKGCWKEGLCWT